MKSTGIVRKVDQLGRVVLPKELRKAYSLSEGTSVEIFTDNEKIILGKYEPADIFTGSMTDLIEYKGRLISKNSIIEMAELAGIKLAENQIKKSSKPKNTLGALVGK